MRKKFSFGIYSLVFLWVMVAIFCMHLPPKYFWPTAFIALSTPAALLLNFLFLVIYIFRQSWKAVVPLLVLVLAWDYHDRGLALNFKGSGEESGQLLKVLSYNVRIFNTYAHLQDKNQTSSKRMIRWVAENPADVICLQEYYNDPNSQVFNTISRIGRQKDKYTFLSKTLVNRIGAQFGLAIFSKFPIINRGTIKFGKLTQNHAMFADLKLPDDTVRVYNFHFQSMSIDEQDIVDTYSDQDSFKRQGKNLLRRFKKGFVKRSDQVNILADHIAACPYPVILCGDLNDLPYSYTYQRLNKDMKNAFSESGWGIGATYNGKLPFVRIDNQFCSPGLDIREYTLHDSVTYSDHFPITVSYRLPAEK